MQTETQPREMNSYLAVAIAEGFCEGEGASANEQMDAWAYIIKTGMAWTLQGWFGRTVNTLIKDGWISREGEVLNYPE